MATNQGEAKRPHVCGTAGQRQDHHVYQGDLITADLPLFCHLSHSSFTLPHPTPSLLTLLPSLILFLPSLPFSFPHPSHILPSHPLSPSLPLTLATPSLPFSSSSHPPHTLPSFPPSWPTGTRGKAGRLVSSVPTPLELEPLTN